MTLYNIIVYVYLTSVIICAFYVIKDLYKMRNSDGYLTFTDLILGFIAIFIPFVNMIMTCIIFWEWFDKMFYYLLNKKYFEKKI